MGTNNTNITTFSAPIVAASFADLSTRLSYLSSDSVEQVRQACLFADQAHLGQMRKNGDPYITHPIAVAIQCADWQLDVQALTAALLHDTLEDCNISKTELTERFSLSVAELVDGLTKIDKIYFSSREENQSESLRKMLLATAQDIRVILIKLADRLHNMRTMGDMKREKWKRIATETMNIYVPIALQMGMNRVYRELQELSFRYLFPWRFEVLARAMKNVRDRRRKKIEALHAKVQTLLGDAGLSVRMQGREKTLYSIYQMMRKKHLEFSRLTDIYGLQIIFPAQSLDCYTALGILHQHYKLAPGKLKDYIALPKPNGYQSLHTTLLFSGIEIELQLRTENMHQVAESGVATYWLYKNNGTADIALNEQSSSQWFYSLQSLIEIGQETSNPSDFLEHVTKGLSQGKIQVFTPKGAILVVPKGATVIDFAYAIHTNIGDHAVAAEVNRKAVPLHTPLNAGDMVNVVTESHAVPQLEWLEFVQTARARSRIRHQYNLMADAGMEEMGIKLLQNALNDEGLESFSVENIHDNHDVWKKLLAVTGHKTTSDLFIEIGSGKRMSGIVAKRIASLTGGDALQHSEAILRSLEHLTVAEEESHSIILDGSENGSVQFPDCCYPIPGDSIVGYLGRGEGMVIHCHDCAAVPPLRSKNSERFVKVEWSDHPSGTFSAGVDVTAKNGTGVLGRIASTIAGAGVEIEHIDMGKRRQDRVYKREQDLHLVVSVNNTEHLATVLRALNRAASVLEAKRRINHRTN